MQVNLIIILLSIYARLETCFLIWVRDHHTSGNSFFNLLIKLLYALDAYFLTVIFRAPDRQRCTPITRTAQVPVVQILQPFAKSSCTSAFRFPVNALVQLHHALLASGRTDKPAIQRIIQYRLICTPAMRIVVHMFLYFKRQVVSLHLHADIDIQAFGSRCSLLVILAVYGKLRIVSVLHPTGLILLIYIVVDALFDKFLIQVCGIEELTSKIYHWTILTLLGVHENRWNTCCTSHESIVSTEGRSYMHDASTIFSRHIVARNHAERLVSSHMPLSFGIHLNWLHELQ